jgi:DNA invertase Pin-like site-specific DNA recombinase
MKHAYKIGLENQKGIYNSGCKKTEDEIILIIKLLNENILTQKEIGYKFGLSQSHISNIKHNKRWSYLIIKEK